MTEIKAVAVNIGSRIRILTSRNPDRIGKCAVIIGARRPGRSAVTGQANYVHPVDIDGVGRFGPTGKPLCIEDGTFEVVSGNAAETKDTMSAEYALKLLRTGDADGVVGSDGIVRLDDEKTGA